MTKATIQPKTHLKRADLQKLIKWDKSKIRSPLLLVGPRQVGKSTLLKQLASSIGRKTYEVNFWEDPSKRLQSIFKKNGNAKNILKALADHFEVNSINTEEDVLLLDEIQECQEAYSSLKSFKERTPELRVLATGSYLQLFLKNENLKKLPVGCVDEYKLTPLTFTEFLENTNPSLFEKFQKISIAQLPTNEPLHDKLTQCLNDYFFTGGLPEIVQIYNVSEKNVETRNLIRKKQKDLLTQYTLDFQKYGKSIYIKKIDKVFQSIPFQLEKSIDDSVSRFMFNELGSNVKYSELHWPFEFLKNAGLILKSYFVSQIDQPFRTNQKLEERNIFKCFYFDIGLLQAALSTPLNSQNEDIGYYKGYIAENFIATMIYSRLHHDLITYKKNSKSDSAEVEFVLNDSKGHPIPIEVKSSKKSLQSKSLNSFIHTFHPPQAFKLVPTAGGDADKYIATPLYLIEKILDEIG